MNITLTVVVAAIVILITALVVITIFGSSMNQVGTMAQARAYCEATCQASLKSTGGIPITWDVPNVRVGDSATPVACSDSKVGATCTPPAN
jgi:hypothetical protein